LDEEDDNNSKDNHPKPQSAVKTTTFVKGNHSKLQATTVTTTSGAEYLSGAQGIQGDEHQDEEAVHADPQNASPNRGAISDPQDDPQDVDLKRGAIIDPLVPDLEVDHQDLDPEVPDLEADPQDPDPDRGAQVNPQPLPTLSLENGIPIDKVDEVDEHEIDEQSHLNHNPETQIQVPRQEVPHNWRAPTVSYIQRELVGSNQDFSGGPGLSSTKYTVWRPSNPFGTPEHDQNGVILGIDSDGEDNSRPQGSRQGDLEEGID